MNQVTDAETANLAWKSLYRVGGTAALIVVVLILIQSFIFIAYPPPSTVIDYFTLFQNNRILGLLGLDLLLTVINVLLIPIYPALYAALRRANESFMAISDLDHHEPLFLAPENEWEPSFERLISIFFFWECGE